MNVKLTLTGQMLLDTAGSSGALVLQYLGGSLYLEKTVLADGMVPGPCARVVIEGKPARGNYGFTLNVVKVLEWSVK